MNERFIAITTVVCIGVLMAMLFLAYTHFADGSSRIQALEFDLDTITASDYTIEFKITKEHYKEWLEKKYNKGKNEVPAIQLEKHMQKKIEHILNHHENTFNNNLPAEELAKRALEALMKGKGKKIKSKIADHTPDCKNSIADVVFAYNNEKLIELLKKRGQAIKYLKFDEMRKFEAEIDTLKSESVEGSSKSIITEWTVPACVFITFLHDDAKQTALDLAEAFSKEQKNPQLKDTMSTEQYACLIKDFNMIGNHYFNEEHVSEAPDPTDIIWENRHWSDRELMFRKAIAFTICIGLLVGSFFILLATSKGQISFSATFPPVDCSIIREQYGK